MKVTKKELLSIWKQLEMCKNLKGVKFVYAVTKNLGVLRNEYTAIEKAKTPPQEFMAFENERVELCRRMADKTPDGKPVMVGNSFLITVKKEEFDGEISKLRETYADAIAEQNKSVIDLQNLLEEIFEFDPFTIDIRDLPDDITGGQLDHLDWMIRDVNE